MNKVDIRSLDKFARRCLHVAKDATKAAAQPRYDHQPKLTLGEIRDLVTRHPVEKSNTVTNAKKTHEKFTLGEIRDVLKNRKKGLVQPIAPPQQATKLTLGQIHAIKQQGHDLGDNQRRLKVQQVRDWPDGKTRSIKKPKSTLDQAKLTFNQVSTRNTSGSLHVVQPNMTLGRIRDDVVEARANARAKSTSTHTQPKMTFGEFREIAAENWERRCDLASAYRGLAKYNLHEGVCNHLTVRAPSVNSDGDVMITAPYGLFWTDITPHDLVAIDMETGELVEGNQTPEITAQSIHLGMYKHRPDVNCIIHTHAVYSSILGTLKDPRIKMLHQTSTRFLENVAYDQDFPLMANQKSNQEGERLGKILGDKEVLLMGHHGLATVGKSVPLAFDLHYYFEKAAEIQILAYQSGQPLQFLPDDVVSATHGQMVDCQQMTSNAHFYALQETLKKEDPTYLSKR